MNIPIGWVSYLKFALLGLAKKGATQVMENQISPVQCSSLLTHPLATMGTLLREVYFFP